MNAFPFPLFFGWGLALGLFSLAALIFGCTLDVFPETPTKRCNRSKGRIRFFIWVRRRFDFRSSPRWGRERWRSLT